jgi:hypothetical protein
MERNLAALVIGNSSYVFADPLRNPTNDAEDVSAKLVSLGFSVITLTNATSQQMEEALRKFDQALQASSVGLVFFAGHAFQIDGKNYLAAVDTKIDDELRVKYSALDLDFILDVMKRAAAPTGFVILDACRNNPFAGRPRSVASNELAPVYAPKGTLVAFSTSPGQIASDGTGRNGSYTEALLQHIDTPNLLIETMFKRVRSTLESITGGRQTSWEHTSLTGDFRFRPSIIPILHGYASWAIADSLAPHSSTVVGVVIEALKSYNWYRQNPALDGLSMEEARSCSTDELFVLGRNIYQAACGYANSTDRILTDFLEVTAPLAGLQSKAILDGMLYEVFFDSEGQHRDEPKLQRFNELFKLQANSALSSSFAFVQGCLAPFADWYFEIPGSGREVVLSVHTSVDESGAHAISAIWWDSVNILRNDPEAQGRSGWFAPRDRVFTYAELRQFLSERTVLPLQQLKVELEFPYTTGTKIIWPAALEMQKPTPSMPSL